MLKIILNRTLLLCAGFKVQKFNSRDYKTMCSLIKQKFPVYNEAIQLNKDVKLLDERGKLIGQYSASEARKKAATMKKDIILVNPSASPAICKLENFRESVLKKFFEEVVNKRNQQIIKKASSSKQLKISTNLSENELEIKAKQIVELAKKNFNVRVYSICKNEQRDQGLAKFDHLKSLVQNKCIVEKDIKVEEFQEKDEDDFGSKKKEKERDVKNSISVVFKSKENQFANMLTQTSSKDPQHALQIFLKRFYKQEDVDMRDLQATSVSIEDQVLGQEDIFATKSETKPERKQKSKEVKKGEGQEGKRSGTYDEVNQFAYEKQRQLFLKQNSFIQREAKAKILNERLKRILEIN